MDNPKISVIIPAAGLSKRFSNSSKKQFTELRNKPLLLHCIELFEQNINIDEIVVVCPDNDMKTTHKLVKNINKIKKIVPGGKERHHSVRAGFFSISDDTDLVLIHDAARPFVTNELIKKIIEECVNNKAVICAIPINDTVKEVGTKDLTIRKTIPRETVWRAQTPQAFRYKLLEEIYNKIDLENIKATDESQLAELIGVKVKIVEGSPFNIKITDSNDFTFAESLIDNKVFNNV